jgi:[ribosomal protein S5]-alanine N-acetyltransferase
MIEDTGMKFHTPRLTLREFTLDDAGFILALLNDPAFIRFIGDRNVRSLEDARNYLKGPLESYQRYGFGLWMVEDKQGTPLGICGLIKRDSLPNVDIGYAFLPEFRSQGYAFEAARASIAFGRDTLKLNRILAIVSPENERSIRLLEKLGMKFERMISLPNDDTELKLFAVDL